MTVTAKPYAGIGSRETPERILRLMSTLAFQLGRHGYKLRTGRASGADKAFEQGARNLISRLQVQDTMNQFNKEPAALMELFVPRWPAHETRPSEITVPEQDMMPNADGFTDRFHPAPNKLNTYTRQLHNRNAHQILGRHLAEPVHFVVCWTQDGSRKNPIGGIGQAIRIASHYNIRVYNLGTDEDLGIVWTWLKRLRET